MFQGDYGAPVWSQVQFKNVPKKSGEPSRKPAIMAIQHGVMSAFKTFSQLMYRQGEFDSESAKEQVMANFYCSFDVRKSSSSSQLN